MGLILGCDPGISGGMAVLNGQGECLWVIPMPTRTGTRGKLGVDVCSLWDLLDQTEDAHGEFELAVIEDVHALATDARSAAFSFGATAGRLKALLELRDYPTIEPPPQLWKKAMLEGTARDKKAAVGYVQGRYPGLSLLPTKRSRVPHDGMAEAVILAEYGLRHLRGGLPK